MSKDPTWNMTLAWMAGAAGGAIGVSMALDEPLDFAAVAAIGLLSFIISMLLQGFAFAQILVVMKEGNNAEGDSNAEG